MHIPEESKPRKWERVIVSVELDALARKHIGIATDKKLRAPEFSRLAFLSGTLHVSKQWDHSARRV